MTRDDAIALLELMRREQGKSDIPPLQPEAAARGYIRMLSQLERRRRSSANADAAAAQHSCC